jgi:sugar phosphate isomerase/epimerase
MTDTDTRTRAHTDDDLLASYWTQAGDTEPFTGREWSPWTLEDRLRTLSEVGFGGIGIFHADLEHLLAGQSYTLPEIDALLGRHGMTYVELEFLTEWPLDSDDDRRRAEADTRHTLFEAADVLDADHVKVANAYGHDVPESRLRTRFADLCREAAEVGTEVGYELLPPDPVVDSLADALAVTDRPANGGLFLDSWHLAKMGVPTDEIRRLAGSDIVGVEVSDGYHETGLGFLEETVNLRKLPGEGRFDVAGFVDAVRATGFDGPWGMEVLSAEFRRLPREHAYRLAYEAGTRHLE